MSRIVAFAKTIRNNWKKSVFGVAVVSYGTSYAREKYEIYELMRAYCAEAATYGCVTQPNSARLTNVLVIVNPLANKRAAQKTFDDYCAPILHLAGIAIEILKTDSEGHARRHLEELETLPDAILVAGGDGTVSETITGLLRRRTGAGNTPVGVLPCGRTNTLARQLFGYSDESTVHEVRGLANAAIAVVRGKHTPTDVIKVEPLHDDAQQSQEPSRPIFAVGSIQWGAYRDALALRDKYWYCGPGRDYCAYLFNAFSKRLTWECAAQLIYSPPCAGCSNCFVKQTAVAATAVPSSNNGGANRRWWSGYSAPKGSGLAANSGAKEAALPDYSRIQNPACRSAEQRIVQPHEMLLSHNVQRSGDEVPRLNVQLVGGKPLGAVDFVKEGWSRVRGTAERPAAATDELDVRTVEIRPAADVLHSEESEKFFSIDNEAYEVKPVRVSVLPRAMRLYTH